MKVSELNRLSISEATAVFIQCCSASKWAELMASTVPYDSKVSIQQSAKIYWDKMTEMDYLEAFDGHPKIGDPESLKEKYKDTHTLASNEQSAVEQATEEVLIELSQYNNRYEKKFGFIFIVCATGKSAAEMLVLVKSRINNLAADELMNAANEQAKITFLRIEKLFENG